MSGPDARPAVRTPIPVLVNPGAGPRWSRLRARLEAAFEAEGLEAEIEEIDPRELSDRLRALSGVSVVGVAGGDGTQQAAARAIVNAAAADAPALAPIPAGRLNHFARRLGLEDVATVASAIARSETRTMLLGDVDGRLFLDTAVFGAYADVVRLRERLRPALTSLPAALAAYALTFARWPTVDLSIRTSEGELHRRTIMAWIGTGRGTFPAPHHAPPAASGDPLELVLPAIRGRGAAWAVGRSFVRHRQRRDIAGTPGLEVVRATSIRIDGESPLRVTLDGEPMVVRPPVTVSFRADALRVVSALSV